MTTPDPRFFETLEATTVGALAALTGASCESGLADRPIVGVAVLERGGAGTVSFVTGRKFADLVASSNAGACFVTEKDAGLLPAGCAALVTPAPQAAWAVASASLHRPRRLDPSAPAVHPTAELEDGVRVGHGVVIGAGAQIGAGTELEPNVVVGPGVAIGRGSRIGASAVVTFALVGDRVQIAAHVVIGESGFGVAAGPRGLIDVPQLGRVIIQDGVSIGAHTCVDRGAFDDTVIGENTKIDNLVQVAHNVVIGRNCVIAGHCGLAGSAIVGDFVQMGGRVGLADHVKVGQGAQIAAASGVMHEIPAGERWCGIPARPAKQFFREVAWLTRAAARKDRGERA